MIRRLALLSGMLSMMAQLPALAGDRPAKVEIPQPLMEAKQRPQQAVAEGRMLHDQPLEPCGQDVDCLGSLLCNNSVCGVGPPEKICP